VSAQIGRPLLHSSKFRLLYDAVEYNSNRGAKPGIFTCPITLWQCLVNHHRILSKTITVLNRLQEDYGSSPGHSRTFYSMQKTGDLQEFTGSPRNKFQGASMTISQYPLNSKRAGYFEGHNCNVPDGLVLTFALASSCNLAQVSRLYSSPFSFAQAWSAKLNAAMALG